MGTYCTHNTSLRRLASIAWMSLMLIALASCHTVKRTYVAERHEVKEPTSISKPGKQSDSKIIQEAYSWLGTPYKYASAEKGCGTDCSGMVMKVYQTAAGYTLPRNSEKLAEFCVPVEDTEVRSGDLVFFATGTDPQKVSHVGIMVDEVKFIHASSSKGVVESNLTTPYYRRTFLMFGRVPETAASR